MAKFKVRARALGNVFKLIQACTFAYFLTHTYPRLFTIADNLILFTKNINCCRIAAIKLLPVVIPGHFRSRSSGNSNTRSPETKQRLCHTPLLQIRCFDNTTVLQRFLSLVDLAEGRHRKRINFTKTKPQIGRRGKTSLSPCAQDCCWAQYFDQVPRDKQRKNLYRSGLKVICNKFAPIYFKYYTAISLRESSSSAARCCSCYTEECYVRNIEGGRALFCDLLVAKIRFGNCLRNFKRK